MSDTLTVSNINYKNISGSTITTSTITGSVLNISTLSFQSTVISLGQSTNQAYYNFSGGSFTAGWASTLSTTASTAGAGLSRVQKVTMSQSGQYQLAVQSSVTSYSVVKSSDSGLTWQTLTNGANGLPNGAVAYPQATATGTPAYTSISYSATGQYALASVRGGLLYVSNNATAATPTFTAAGMGTPYIYLPLEGAVTDVMGNSAVTTPGTVPGYVTGIIGTQAVNLANTPGATGSGIRCIRCPWTGSTNFTMSFWFNAQQAVSTSYQYIVTTYSSFFAVVIVPNTAQLAFVIPSGGGTNYQTAALGPIISTNVWYNVTTIFQTGSTCSMYVNNVLYGTYTNVSGVGTTTTTNVALGTLDSSLSYPFNGYIDDFRLYNSAVIFNPIVPANWSHTAVSATGQYMLAAAAGGGLFQSSDFGKTWTQVNALLNSGVWNSLTVSASGQYALATTSAATIQPNLAGIGASWVTNGVSWAASASSIYPTTAAHYAFNTVTTTPEWISAGGTYSTAGNTSGFYTVIQGIGSVQGDWIQLQSSVPLVMYSYQFATGFITARLPKTYYIVGSNDGATWYPIQYGSGGTVTSTGTFTLVPSTIIVSAAGGQGFGSSSVTFTTYSTTTNAYTYFRLVGLSTYSATAEYFSISEWLINFVGGLTYTSNYGQTWSNTANSLFTDFGALSGDGQYTLGISNQLQPYAYLPLDGNQNDSRGVLTNATNGTASGAATFPGTIYKVGTNAVYLANTAGATSSLSYLNYTVPAALYQPGALTMACWVYPTALPLTTGTWTVAMGFNGGSSTSYGTNIGINTNGYAIVQFYNLSTSNSITGTTTISNNTWTHLATTFSNGLGALYVNGALQGTLSGMGGVLNTYNASNPGLNATNLYIGADTTSWGGFAGYIDDVRVYTSALTANAIAELYAVPALNPIPLLYLGNNYLTGLSGSSYTPITLSNINAIINCASCSNTGQYMTVLTQGTTNNVYYSTNYGSTWTVLTVGSSAMTSCAMSADGTYITVSNATNVYTLNWNGQGFTVAMGSAAGAVNQANNAIAIGNLAGQTNQTANSIVLNASGAAVNPYTQGFYVAPVQPAISSTSPTFPLLGYGSDNQIVQSAHSFSNLQQTVYGEWIQYQLATPSPITSYTLQQRSGTLQYRFPASWIIAGSNDGTNWTLLDTQTGTSGWGTYTLTQATASYTYYRMIITQISSYASNYINIGSWILNNGSPIFGASANYTVVASGLYNVLQLNSTTVCTTTFSWPNVVQTNAVGVGADNIFGATYQPGWIPTTDGYTKSSNYYLGFYVLGFGSQYEYNSSYIAFQGTSTTVNTTVLGSTNMSGMLCLMGNSRVGIGSTLPQYSLDVAGTAQVNGPIPTVSGPDSAPFASSAYATLGQSWSTTGTSTLPLTNWQGCAVSGTGQYMTVVSQLTSITNSIYYSSNYGANWTLATGFLANASYSSVAMSANGKYQIATIDSLNAVFYVSTNYGATWVSGGYANGNWARCCLSSNGQYQYVTQNTGTGGIYYSNNYGSSFTQVIPAASLTWVGICCSANGQYVTAGSTTGAIYYSSNYGVSYTATSTTGYFTSFACSASGQYQVGCDYISTRIYYSNNYGVTWSQSSAPASSGWYCCTCTASGQYMLATSANAGGVIYYSTNYGVSWVQSGALVIDYRAISISQNGLYTLAVNNNVGGGATGSVYLSTLTNVGLVTNGRIGIGVTNPASSLHIIGPYASGGLPVLGSTSHSSLIITQQAGQYGLNVVVARESGVVHMQSQYFNGTAAYLPLTLNPMGGNVGIGATNPQTSLHIQAGFGGSTVNPVLGATTNSSFLLTNSSAAYGLNIVGSNTGAIHLQSQYFNGNTNSLSLTLNPMGGYVGVGTTNPSTFLHVSGLKNSGTQSVLLLSNTIGGGYTTNWFVGPNSTGSFLVYLDNGNGAYIAPNATSWAGSSDIRLKDDITSLSNCLQNIINLRPVSYRMKRNPTAPLKSFGLIAQEVRPFLPEVVVENGIGDGMMGLMYTELIPVIIGAIKELASQASSSAAQIQELVGQTAQLTTSQSAILQTVQELAAENTQLKSQLAAQTSAQASAIALLEARLAALEAK
jgi:hypothetical protein